MPSDEDITRLNVIRAVDNLPSGIAQGRVAIQIGF